MRPCAEGSVGAQETVLLIDGASGLEELGQDYFPGCVQFVDLAAQDLPA